jgi:cell division septal protein FtsQ
MFLFKTPSKKTDTNVRPAFEKEMYIPKKTLNKKERSISDLKEKKLDLDRRRFWWVWSLWLLAGGELLYILFWAGVFSVQNIEIQYEGSIAHQELEQDIWGTLLGKWGNLIIRNNLLFIQEEKIMELMRGRHPKLAAVRIQKQFPHRLIVEAQDKPYQVLWCTGPDCFLVDGEGRAENSHAFFEHRDEQGRVYTLRDESQTPVTVGEKLLDEKESALLGNIVQYFELRTGFTITGELVRPGVFSQEIRITTNQGFRVFLSARLPFDQSLDALMLFLEREIPLEERDKVDYVDLRTENRIYYTRKDRAPDDSAHIAEAEKEAKKKEESIQEGLAGDANSAP